MADRIIAAVLLVLVGAAVRYIIREKKKGSGCIGCSEAGACAYQHCKCTGCHPGTDDSDIE